MSGKSTKANHPHIGFLILLEGGPSQPLLQEFLQSGIEVFVNGVQLYSSSFGINGRAVAQ
jgi:hypothetical protein